jgi:hypothetical protein
MLTIVFYFLENQALIQGMTNSATFNNFFYQQLLNHRSRSFGGSSRLMGLVLFVYWFVNITSCLSLFVGDYYSRSSVTWNMLIGILFSVNGLYQAITLESPRISEDHEE